MGALSVPGGEVAMGTHELMELVDSFFKAADLQVVLVVMVFTYAIYRIFLNRGYPRDDFVIVSVLLAVPITYAFSAADEVSWGGRFLWNVIIKNAAVSVAAWMFIVPQVFKRWPQLFGEETRKGDTLSTKGDRVSVPSAEERKWADDALRVRTTKGEEQP